MKEKAIVAIASDFLTAFAKLPRQVQGKVTEFVNKFRNCPTAPGINYEKLSNGIDKKIYSVRIDDTYRGIVARQPETGVYLLLWVDHHDKAYQWAARKRCEVNPQTGAIQMYEVKTIEEQVAVPAEASLFKNASDEELLTLGVPKGQLRFVRSFTTAEAFYQAKSEIPHDAYEYLAWLVEGIDVAEVLELAKDAQPAEKAGEDLAAAFDVSSTLMSFVVVEGEDELRRIMAEPLENWRVFLHPLQRKIVKKNYSGSARVLGGAGTGKTVVAMHRAKFLADTLGRDERILFTTFTSNLAADIQQNLRKICTVEELRKIEVVHLDAWVSQYLKSVGFKAQVRYGDELTSLWQKAIELANVDLPFEADFYEEEWSRVAVAQDALSQEKYMKALRSGRGTGLNRKKRMLIWKVFENYRNLMNENQVRDIDTAMYDSAILLSKAGRQPQYASIVVDEGQDLSDSAYRLLRALSGEPHANDIFIVGDSHQRIYRNRPTLSKCGINVRGRSTTLKINYRTTEEIRRYAFALLNDISFDDLDDGVDLGDRCQSLTHGTKPIVKSFKDANGEFEYLLDEIKRLTQDEVALSDICIVARTKKLVDDYIAQLTKAGIASYSIKRNKTEDRKFAGVRVATMHRVKGLEFKYVFVVAVNNKIVPLASAINNADAVSEAESMTAEKCLLYVALTRAQKGAYITSYGKASPLLP